RLDELRERVGDLLAEPLLHREATRVEADEPRQLRDTQDLVARDVADVRRAVERQRMVLAQREERDRALDDLAVPAVCMARPLGWKGRPELRVAAVASGRVEHRLQEPARRVTRARCVELHPERREDLADVRLVASPVLRVDRPPLLRFEARRKLNDAQALPPDRD